MAPEKVSSRHAVFWRKHCTLKQKVRHSYDNCVLVLNGAAYSFVWPVRLRRTLYLVPSIAHTMIWHVVPGMIFSRSV